MHTYLIIVISHHNQTFFKSNTFNSLVKISLNIKVCIISMRYFLGFNDEISAQFDPGTLSFMYFAQVSHKWNFIKKNPFYINGYWKKDYRVLLTNFIKEMPRPFFHIQGTKNYSNEKKRLKSLLVSKAAQGTTNLTH